MPDADKEDALARGSHAGRQDLLRHGQRSRSIDLTNKVKDRLANKTDKRVFVKADARAKYGSVVEVVDNVRSAGVDDLGLLTEQRKQLGSNHRLPPTTGAG